MCNTPSMVVSVVTRHLCDCHPCHFANTHHNLCPLLTTMECFECTMHIWCFHLVVTPLVSIHQPWCVFQHQVCVIEHLVHVLWMWWWLCLQPVITTIDDVACCCEKSLKVIEWMRDGMVRIHPSEPFESRHDLVGMLCG